MIISELSVDRKDMYEGMLVHIDEETADFFSIPGRMLNGDDKYLIPHGLWEIVSVSEHISYDLGPTVQETTWVELSHADWDEEIPFLVVLNRDSHAVLAGTVILDNPFRLVIVDRCQLDKANRNRSLCAGCGNPLNIITANLKICNRCEQDLGV